MIEEHKNGYTIRDRRLARDASLPGGVEPAGPQVGATSLGLFATPRSTGQYDYYRPRPFPGQNTSRVTDYEWKELVTFSRQLFAQMPNLAHAVIQKNMYAVGDSWKPHYSGANTDWGAEAEDWLLHQWYPNCDIRGGNRDFNTNLFLSGVAWDVDGDDLCIYVIDEDTGWPKLKYVQAMDIGSRMQDRVKGGPFDGAKLRNGVLLDDDDQFLGVQVLAEDQKDDMIVPAYNCQLSYEPEFRALYRGVPPMGRSVMDAFDFQDILQFLKRTVKLHSSQGVLHWTETGEPMPGTDAIIERIIPQFPGNDTSTAPPTDVRVEKVLGGEITYLHAGHDEKLEAFKSDVPHMNTEFFLDRLERHCCLAVRWFRELVDPTNIKGANIRLIQDGARHSVSQRQRTLRIRAKRAILFALGQAQKLGLISTNPDPSDVIKWTFNHPAQITVDAGYDEQADQNNLRLGTTTMAAICEKKGKWWEHVRTQNLRENKDLIQRAAKLVKHAGKKGQNLTFREAIDMMRQFGANPRQPLLPVDPETGETAPAPMPARK